MKDAEDELSNLENLLDKEEVLERLGELRNDINKKRSAVREPFNDQDDLGRALADLHRKYLDLMRDLERERRKQVCNPFYRSKYNYKYPGCIVYKEVFSGRWLMNLFCEDHKTILRIKTLKKTTTLLSLQDVFRQTLLSPSVN